MALKFWRWLRTSPPPTIGFWQYVLHYGVLRVGLGTAALTECISQPLLHKTWPLAHPFERIPGGLIIGLLWGIATWYALVRSGVTHVSR
jgi:hypothetical protein